jgi:hypothetical protein
LALFTHATQPEAAFVAIVTVFPVVEVVVVERFPEKVSVLPEREKLKVAGTVAVTTIWSSETRERAYPEESMVAGPEVRVVMVPVLSFPAVVFVRVLVPEKLKQ